MRRLDCLGDMCPLPLMKLMQCWEPLNRGEHVMLITDQSCTLAGILSYCNKQKLRTSVNEPISGVWEITIYEEMILE